MKIKFCGADRTVTGSQHLLEINGKKILLDCGLYQGKREAAYEINRNFLFDPREVHCVVLSHAHIDHSGNLPMLYSKGFDGSIYSTSATRDLCAIMLLDSAHIQEKDTEYVNKKRARQNLHPFKPLYRVEHAKHVMENFKTIDYRKKFFIEGLGDSVAVEFYDAGHILGSAMVVLEIKENGKKIRFAFSGDIGRHNLPILRDPEFIGDCDYFISESTYGGRVHDKAVEMDKQLQGVLEEAVSRGGKTIVPAFSVGRTQEIIYALATIFQRGDMAPFPVFVDSPLSARATDIFKIHPECYDKELMQLIHSGIDVFDLPFVNYIKDVEESKRLNSFKGPCMIVSASGMAESGRILHHLKNNIESPATTILIVGFMAEHTLGRRLIESRGVPDARVNIFGEEYSVEAKVVVLNSFSAHADRDELRTYFDQFDRGRLQNIYLVHGELDQQEALKGSLTEMNFGNIEIPVKGQVFEI